MEMHTDAFGNMSASAQRLSKKKASQKNSGQQRLNMARQKAKAMRSLLMTKNQKLQKLLAAKEQELEKVQKKRDQFRLKPIYFVIPALTVMNVILEIIPALGWLAGALIMICIIFPLRLIWLFFLPKDVKQYLLIEKKAVMRTGFTSMFSVVTPVVNADMVDSFMMPFMIMRHGQELDAKIEPLRKEVKDIQKQLNK